MPYKLLRPFLFLLPPETAHHLTLLSLKYLYKIGLLRYVIKPTPQQNPVTIAGLKFNNPIGLAAGLDKNGEYIDALAALGFGFIEVGTVTPKPQPGNPKPRLFRLKVHNSLINRMGFNNQGVDYLIDQIEQSSYQGILGINIGKNASTPLERAVDDYVVCLQKVYRYASYITINISSPNTKNLRDLQQGDLLDQLLSTLKQKQTELVKQHDHTVPLFVKVAPDLDQQQIEHIATKIKQHKMDGLIATNTLVDRSQFQHVPGIEEQGGISGKLISSRSNQTIAAFRHALGKDFPIIGVGGIHSIADAKAHLQAGANMLQLYTGLIYQGPSLIRQIQINLSKAPISQKDQ